jgi:hypothetical protein
MTTARPAYFEIIDFIASGTTPESVISFHPSRDVEERVSELIEREKDGTISPDEKDELDQVMELEHIIRMAKIRAREILSSGH